MHREGKERCGLEGCKGRRGEEVPEVIHVSRVSHRKKHLFAFMHVKIFHWAALPNAAAADTVVRCTDGGMVAYIFNITFS